ncbi:non-ribosomal peptide synthetase/type I polyketide synthase [Chitinophaga sp. HK235]|uniref:non-ribosomal peptide synthetase/type I polyketide synthase n=1 Tax=Chitinophaga sp. HK235 TaxID=2952571 RepID=UPI001BAA2D0E|nr:non-ribosomal peptide synthetase/type I polyketide synthase [Chitinophaga sp. HK235]
MENIHSFFYRLRLNAGAIWLDNGKIKLSAPEKFQDAETDNFIVHHKPEILSVLRENEIFSKEKFLSTIILRDNVTAEYPLSSAQERLWFIEEYEEGTNAYHVPAVYELGDATDVEGLKYAFRKIVARHEILRTTIEGGDRQAVQVVHKKPLAIQEFLLSANDDLEEFLLEDINRPFDLRKEYPIRVKFYRIEAENADADKPYAKTVLLINMHHIASDGWSAEVFERELSAYYQAYIRKDMAFNLPALEIQYKDYALWQRSCLTGETLDRQLSYWKDRLSGYQTLTLPTDYPRPEKISYSGAHQTFTLSKEVSDRLKALVRKYGVTMHSVLLSSINILLGKYTGQDDILIGSPIANRHYRQTQDLIGFFVNTVINRTQLNNTQSYGELIQEVHRQQMEAQQHQDLPFEKLVSEMGVEQDLSRHPLFQIIFVVQSFGSNPPPEQQVFLKSYEGSLSYEVEKFDLSVMVNDSGEEIAGRISYATSLFREETIARLIQHYIYLLDTLTQAPEKAYSSFSLLSPEEYRENIYSRNATGKAYPKGKTIHQLFEEQTAEHPDNIALVYQDQQLSYRALNEKSNQLARYIREQYRQRTGQELKPDALIALCMDRGLEMVVSILAVLKAGGAYVPMDPSYPQQRIDFILEDTGAVLVLSLRRDSELQLPAEKVLYADLTEELYRKEDASNLPACSSARDLAYIIYTSGTTGKPKGVMIEHESVMNLVFVQKEKLEINTASGVLQYASLVFDASVWEIFSALTLGARLIIVPGNIRQDAQLLSEYMNENGTTTALLPPVLLSVMSSSGLQGLKTLVAGGDVTALKLMQEWSQGRKLVNAYGPTENTVIASMHVYTAGDLNTNIGKPINNAKLHILDSGLQPVPVGVIGELHIGGAGLARGYLNNSELTAERFITDPFATEEDNAQAHTRLYKTGDLARWLADGSIEYMGRNDEQVKVRGFRIELAEIEQALLHVPGIRQSCVLVKERVTASGNDKYLAGYYVPDTAPVAQDFVLDRLSEVLPDYMLPGSLVSMESFPLTINGKLDKRALPDPEFNTTDTHVPPATELENKLCQLYAEVLGLAVEQIGIHQNFFRIGGNSIKSIQLKKKLNQLDEFKHIGAADLFKYNTIQKLVESIRQDAATTYKLQKNIQGESHEIAIVAVSGAFSGVDNVDELWQIISSQQEGLRFYSKDECRELQLDDALVEHPDFVPVAGKVKDIELFDPMFWELSPNEARQLDPQIRKFIEHCWFALESSGYVTERGKYNIGVFAGSGENFYLHDRVLRGEMAGQVDAWEAFVSNSKHALATQTAYLLDLTGPANSINTACSTGLVAVVEACKNLQLGVCDMALAGGVSLGMPEHIGYLYREGMTHSRDGHCRTFDQDSSGTTSGSGVGVVLLKRLKDAVEDRDHILGVIKGYATNNDGARKTGYTAPSVTGQTECIINAQRMAGITSDQIDYVECHGTATQLGDPIEVQALRDAFAFSRSGKKDSARKTMLGAVKANIGHTDTAAGVAGLIKVCAMLQHNIMPGQVNFNTPNAELKLEDTGFGIIKENRPWQPVPGRQRLAGVSAFGIGGTNAHVIVGDYIPDTPATQETDPVRDEEVLYIVPVSAKSRQSLENYKQALIKTCEANPLLKINDIAYTLQEKRAHFQHRSAYCVKNITELADRLKQDTSYGQAGSADENRMVLMFPGQGVQYVNMTRDLYQNGPSFKNTIDHCISLANQHLDADLFKVIYADGEGVQYDINDMQWAPISLFVIEYSLARYLEELGIKADAYIGHSLGEYVAATIAGVFALEDAIRLVIARGQLMLEMEPGGMLAINAREETIKEIVTKHNCDIAVINSTEDIIASGEVKDVDNLQYALEQLEIPVVRISVPVAGHSRMMDETARKFNALIRDIKLNKPAKPFISNLSGEIATDEVATPEYWCKQLRDTVQFAKGIDCLSRKYNHKVSFVEIGPGKGLCYFVGKYRDAYSHYSIGALHLLPSAKEANDAYLNMDSRERIIAKLWMNGIIQQPNESRLFGQAVLLRSLPVYQFNHRRYWLEKGKDNVSAYEPAQLPEAEKTIEILENKYSETEYQVAQIFAELLGLEQISLHDDFFKIGGNSILAIRASHKISKLLGKEIKVTDVFKHRTIAQLLLHNPEQAAVIISRTDDSQVILSFAQERLWFIEEYEEGTNAYHIPAVYELGDATDPEGLKYALRQIVARHEVLRTTIEGRNRQGIQLVHQEPLPVEEIQLTASDDLEVLLTEDINRPFDLQHDYPIRVKFYKTRTERRILLINIHHIATDGWSIEIFQKELLAYYQAYMQQDTSFSLPALEIQYKDFALWQRTWLTGEMLDKQLNYWKDRLSGYQTLVLPTDYPRPARIDYSGAREAFLLNKALSDRLRALVRQHGVTIHSALLSSAYILFGKYTGQDDILIGSPIANRHHRQTQDLIGFFVNTLTNRALLSNTQSFEELVRDVHQQQMEAQQYQDLPFEKLVSELGVEQDPSRHPLFQVAFAVQSFANETAEQQKAYLKPYEGSLSFEIEKFDLSILIDDSGEEIRGQVSYATSLFREETISRLIRHFIQLLETLTKAPEKEYNSICLLSPEEYRQIVYEWTATDKLYPKGKTFHQYFEEQATESEDNIALVCEDQQLSYKQLNEKSNQLARQIRTQYRQRTGQELKPDTLIALCQSRGLEMIVSILAVLKAGGAYVPLDPSYPQQRIDYILEDTGAALILCQRKRREVQLPEEKILYADLTEDFYLHEDIANLPAYSSSRDLAYIIYTSGTTGKPKGVMIEHESLMNLVFSQRDRFNINPESKVVQYASLVFDASAWDIFSTLAFGAQLFVVTGAIRQDGQLLTEYMDKCKITNASLPPVLLNVMSSSGMPALKTLVVSGEVTALKLMQQWSQGRELINGYGPTENTVGSSLHSYSEGDLHTNIGKALENVKFYILDPSLQPVPVGVTGELYIGGAGLARGYFHNEELTAARFIANPFATEGDNAKGYTRLYKTGDLVRWMEDGSIDYIGRNDEQVKIRGFRIELPEIEQALLQIPGIRQSCVLAKERQTASGSTKYLVGYYVPDRSFPDAASLTQEFILDTLAKVLPEYMMPAGLVAMESFPLTINRKLDKRAFPDPGFNVMKEAHVPPATELENKLCLIYAEVLGLASEQISTQHNFFRIGGNSVLSIQLKKKLNELDGFEHISPADLFKYNTIQKLVQFYSRERAVSLAQDEMKTNS